MRKVSQPIPYQGKQHAAGTRRICNSPLEGFVRDFFSGYDGDPVEVPIELAREVVLGSAGYARSLGFDPHPDFAAAEGHLGLWTAPGAITFGKDGKPLYISGPYDDPRPVIRTLERTVGRGNFEYLVAAG
jgi:hypothetical protein